MTEEMKKTSLPENAFRELKEGEQYEPLMAEGRNTARLLLGAYSGAY